MNFKRMLNNKRRRFIRQQWLGTILNYENEIVTAKIKDLTNVNNPDELITFSIHKIRNRNTKEGSIFYFNIGYYYTHKTKRSFSKFEIIKLPKWTREEIDSAQEKVEEYDKFFNLK